MKGLSPGRLILVLGSAAALAGCASFSKDGGLSAVGELTGQKVSALRSDADEARARAEVRALLGKRLTADSAVRIALLNNRELQAAYNALGISEAEMVGASLPPNPKFSLSRIAGGGNYEIEAMAAANVLALATLPARAEIAQDRFAQAQFEAAEATLRTAAEARRSYYRAVAAQSLADFLSQSQSAAEAAAQLSRQLGEAGTATKLDQARNQVFYAELSAQLGTARQRADSERERLIRALGLWGDDLAFKLPARLPQLPVRVASLPRVETEAVSRRLDLQSARLEVAALEKTYGLKEATRVLNLLEVAGIAKNAKEDGEKIRERGFEVELEVPLFDFGEVGSRKAAESYMQAVNRLTAKAVNVRSEARDAYRGYRSSFDIARHYEREVLPLRKIISDETLLRYNAMQIDVFALLSEARDRIASTVAAIEAQRDFYLAQVNLGTAILGGGSTAGEAPGAGAAMPVASAEAGH
jgi:outer membrane protein TolC